MLNKEFEEIIKNSIAELYGKYSNSKSETDKQIRPSIEELTNSIVTEIDRYMVKNRLVFYKGR